MPRHDKDSSKSRFNPYGRDDRRRDGRDDRDDRDRRRDDRPREDRPRENQDRRRGTGPGNQVAQRRQGGKPDRDALALVPRIEERQYVNQSGQVVAVDAVNRSSGGGRQNRIMAPTATGGLVVKSDRADHFSQAARMIQKQAGASTVSSRMEPVFEDRNAKIRRQIGIRQDMRESWGPPMAIWAEVKAQARRARKAPDARPAGETQEGQTAQGSQSDRVISEQDGGEFHCDNCQGKNHNMASCLWAPEGTITGCTLCHSLTHSIDECQRFTEMPLKQKVAILVYDRAHMPALKTQRPWHVWFVEWLQSPQSRDKDGCADRPEGYPWTERFATDLALEEERILALQAEFDRHHDVQQLPADPRTQDTESVWKTFGPHGHIYPSNVDDLRHAADGKFEAPAGSVLEKTAAPMLEDDVDWEMN